MGGGRCVKHKEESSLNAIIYLNTLSLPLFFVGKEEVFDVGGDGNGRDDMADIGAQGFVFPGSVSSLCRRVCQTFSG